MKRNAMLRVYDERRDSLWGALTGQACKARVQGRWRTRADWEVEPHFRSGGSSPDLGLNCWKKHVNNSRPVGDRKLVVVREPSEVTSLAKFIELDVHTESGTGRRGSSRMRWRVADPRYSTLLRNGQSPLRNIDVTMWVSVLIVKPRGLSPDWVCQSVWL